VTDDAIGELAFLRKLQRLLAEGDFVATYKFALPHDGERSRAFAGWASELGEVAGAHVCIDADRFVRLGSSWRDVLGSGPGGLRRVAEPPPPEYRPE
jgi:hypothetical protein